MLRRLVSLALAGLMSWSSLAIVACHRSTPPAPGTGSGSPSHASSSLGSPLPRNEQDAVELIARRTLRPDVRAPVLEVTPLLERSFGVGWGSVVAGDGPLRARVQTFLEEATGRGHDAYVLFGTFHDSEGQIEAFRRLLGPDGVHGLTHVTVEQLRASGKWADVPEVFQLGDDSDIGAYLERGDVAAFGRLRERHRDSDYAAWKLGYVPSVLDLLVTARAASPSFWLGGCDMPTGTQELAAKVPEPSLRRLREIHCLDALGEATPHRSGPRRVLMLWGQAHLESLQSFLPPSAEVLSLYVLGFRAGPATLEAKLAPSLVVTDPLFLPLDDAGDTAVLVYPDAVLGASIDRVHEAGELRPTRIAFVSPVGARILVGEHTVDIVPRCASGACEGQGSVDVPPGDYRYVGTFAELRMAGAVHLRQGVTATLRFDPTARAISLVERGGPQ